MIVWGLPWILIFALYAVSPVTVDAFPRVGMRPLTVRVRVRVPRHAENRELCYSLDGPELKRSCFSLNGADERRSWTVYWHLETAGEYEASATLLRVHEGRAKVYRDTRAVSVLGPEF